jgi:hypothetical protein
VNTAVVLALIALAGSIASTLLTVFGAPALQARSDAKKALDNYREPLLAAAFELQARIYNILRLKFVEIYIAEDSAGKRDAAINSTLYVFAQFFGWREIIRQEVQYLRFPRHGQTEKTARLLAGIDETFLASQYGHQFMIWRVEQRGMGERMIATADSKRSCLGYALFLEQYSTMQAWLQPLEHDLKHLDDDGRKRLTDLQHQLLDLVRQLDAEHRRYSVEELKRA